MILIHTFHAPQKLEGEGVLAYMERSKKAEEEFNEKLAIEKKKEREKMRRKVKEPEQEAKPRKPSTMQQRFARQDYGGKYGRCLAKPNNNNNW